MDRKKKKLLLRFLIIPTIMFSLLINYEPEFVDHNGSIKTTVVRKIIKENKHDVARFLVVNGEVKNNKYLVPKSIFDIIAVGDTVNITQSKYSGAWVNLTVVRNGVVLINNSKLINSDRRMVAFLFVFIGLFAFLPERWLFYVDHLTQYSVLSLTGAIFVFGGGAIFGVLLFMLR